MRSHDVVRQMRLLDSGPLTAAEHMALDEVLLEAVGSGQSPSTFRFLQFKPCALLGLHQKAELELHLDYCRHQGVEINRRITGGGSLYWGPSELGWELYASRHTPGLPRRVDDLYRYLCQGMAAALGRLGIEAAYRPVNDIEVRGRKICGSGGSEYKDAFVFQCSLLVDVDVREMMRVLKLPAEKLRDKGISSLEERMTTVTKELGRRPDMAALKAAVLQGLEETVGFSFVPGALQRQEQQAWDGKLPRFRSESWIFGAEEGVVDTVDATANYKAPGGLIRVQARLDEKRRFLKFVWISGDFFAYPAKAIRDLEAYLKHRPADVQQLGRLIDDFFWEHKVEIPGVEPRDFAKAVALAVEKAREGRPVG